MVLHIHKVHWRFPLFHYLLSAQWDVPSGKLKLSVQVVDMTDRIVAQIADQNLSAGSHALPISTVNLAGGVYTIRLATVEGVVTRRLVVVR